MNLRLAILVPGILALAGVLPAQCPPPAWSGMNVLPGLSGHGSAVTSWDPDGSGPAAPVMVVGGGFSHAGAVSANNIATWDGVAWHALGSGVGSPSSLNEIQALCVYNGELIAGGWFTSAGGVSANRVARWNGSIWQPLGSGLNDTVSSLVVYNGELIVGGTFTVAGGVPAAKIARWNGSAWQSLGNGPNNNVGGLCVHNGLLIATGHFTEAGGLPAGSVASWDGVTWLPLGAGVAGAGYLGFVGSAVSWNGQLVVAGYFATAGGVTAPSIASWDGASWSPLGIGGPGPYPYSSVDALTVFGGDLIAGGGFSTIGGVAVQSVARWDGASWHPLGGGIAIFFELAVHAGELVAVGFGSVPTVAANGVARWTGTAWLALSPGINYPVWSMTVAYGDLIAAARISNVNGSILPSQVHRWNGTSWSPLGTGMDDWVNAMTVFNGDLIAAGPFLQADGQVVNSIARWVGSSWVSMGGGTNGTVHALAIYNGELIAGGLFTTAGGALANNVARWDGTAWQPLGAGTGGQVNALALWNGELVVGGYFQSAGFSFAPGVARWNGLGWQPFGAGLPNAGLETLTVFGGELIAGGWPYTTFRGPWRWTGASWQTLGTGVNGNVESLLAYDGELIAGGQFTSAGPAGSGGSASYVARWNGAVWQGLGSGVDGPVYALETYQGSLVAGGLFWSAGGIFSPAIARWSSPRPLLALTQPSGAGTGVEAANRWLIPGHEYYNVFSFDLSPDGPGTGPYAGLSFINPAFLLQQLLLPVGALPTHFVAAGPEVTFGPYLLPLGTAFEAVVADVTGGVLGCAAAAQRYVVY